MGNSLQPTVPGWEAKPGTLAELVDRPETSVFAKEF